MTARRILLVEDEPLLREAMRRSFVAHGLDVTEAGDGNAAIAALEAGTYDVLCTDLWMPGPSGLDVIRKARETRPETLVFVITGQPSTESAITALREGVVDYIEKPIRFDQVARRIRDMLEWRDDDLHRKSLRTFRSEPQAGAQRGGRSRPPVPAGTLTGVPGFVSQSPALRGAIALAERYAASDITVLITGETGVGKDVLARHIHARSSRATKPFVACNLSAMPDTLVESGLFGHVKGAFTGADKDHKGFVEIAAGGTLFLDEIGDVSPTIQVKVLRFLESREFYRVGESSPRTADVRIIAATNVTLEDAIRDRFREDLYYRLNGGRIILPPLRDRREDILPLAEAFLAVACGPSGTPKTLSDGVKTLFLDYSWRGNVRELRNAIESAALVSLEDSITIGDLPMHLQQYATRHRATIGPQTVRRIEDAERRVVEEAVERNRGDKAAAARELGVSLRTLYRKLERYAGQSDPVEPEATPAPVRR